MTFDLTRPVATPWLDAADYWSGLDRATAELDPPFGVLSREALAWNAHSLLDRAAGTSIRVATKSIRVRAVIDAVLAMPGFSGVLASTVPEALWLAEEIADVVVGYPTTHRAAIRTLARSPLLAGGTGSIESTAAEAAVTEIAAGSGLIGPHLFDHYRSFRPAPAVGFGLAVVRKPREDIAVALGGGWIASGVTGADRSPVPVWPERLQLMPREGAGEVQTPLTGPGARGLGVGDRVFLRHTKAGELSEHLTELAVVSAGRVTALVPTYRGEGRAFL